ncbi:MAG: hypothetical protein WCP15_02780 [bacterium]
MNLELNYEEIESRLNNWLKEQDKLVIGLDGYSGLGKTTFLKYIVAHDSRVKPVFMDDYVTTANTREMLIPQIKRNSQSLILEWSNNTGFQHIRNLINDFKNDKQYTILLLDGIFLYHPDILDDLWDKKIFLDGNVEEADQRRIKREKERWGEDYFPEDHPDSYIRLFKIAYNKYLELYRPKEKADLVLMIN